MPPDETTSASAVATPTSEFNTRMAPPTHTAAGNTPTNPLSESTTAITANNSSTAPITSGPTSALSSQSHSTGALPTLPSRPPNNYESASCFSRLIFYWPYQLLQLGLRRPLNEIDLPEIVETDSSSYNRQYFDALWTNAVAKTTKYHKHETPQQQQQQQQLQPNLHRAFLYDFIRSIWYVQPFICLSQMAKIVQAVALGYLIDTFEERDNTAAGNQGINSDTLMDTNSSNLQDSGYFWASVLVACGIIILMEHHHVFFVTWRKGMKYRISAISAIYAKSLRLSSTFSATAADAAESKKNGRTNTSATGQIMNLISNDVERFIMVCLFGSHLIWVPLTSIVTLIVGWYVLKTPAFAIGFAFLVGCFVPLQIYLSHSFAKWRSKVASLTDQRVTFVSQAIQGVRVMKMSGYEYKFLEQIEKLREQEVSQIKHANTLKAYNETLFFVANVVLTIVICIVHVLVFDGVLTTRDVFTIVTLINILQLEMTKHMSLGVMGVSECSVSISRIQKFLQFPELPTPSSSSDSKFQILGDDSSSSAKDVVLTMDDVTCFWNDVQKFNTTATVATGNNHGRSSAGLVPAVSNISASFHMGELTCIVGAVGTSSLLKAIVATKQIRNSNWFELKLP